MASLNLSVTNTAASVDLTALAADDWAAWVDTATDAIPLDRKNGGGSLISDASLFGNGAFAGFQFTYLRSLSWTDGTPTASNPDQKGGIYNNYNFTNGGLAATGHGYSVTFPANTSTREARLYIGTYEATLRVTAILSDASVANQINNTLTSPAGTLATGEVIVTYQAGSAAQTLTIRVEVLTANGTIARPDLSAATVKVTGTGGSATVSPTGIGSALVFGSPSVSSVAPPTTSGRYYPEYGDPDYHFPPGSTRVNLGSTSFVQTALSLSTNVRLDKGTYSGSVTINSNDHLYGIPGNGGTFISGTVTIAPGATNWAVIGMGAGGGFVFPASSLVTSRGVIANIAVGLIGGTGCTVDSCQFYSMASGIYFDNSASGYLRNCRFYRPFTHGAGYNGVPAFLIKGNTGQQNSWGNTLIAIAPLGGVSCNVRVDACRDFAISGMAMEDYEAHIDTNDIGQLTGSVWVSNTLRYTHVGFSGRNERSAGLRINATNSNIYCSNFHTDGGTTNLEYGPVAAVAARWDWDNATGAGFLDQAPSTTRIRLLQDGFGTVGDNGNTANPTGTRLTAIQDLVSYSNGSTKQWAEPSWRTIFEPLGAGWAATLAGGADETASLQTILNNAFSSNTVVELAGRAYYTSSALLLNRGQIVVGVPGQTVIVSKTGTHPIWGTRFNANGGGGTTGVSLIDIVSQNGTWGFRQAESGQQLNGADFLGCTWLDMSVAAQGIENSYAWDNIWTAKNKYKRCAQITKQIFTGNTTEPTIAYIDKANWFRCFAEDCGYGWVFQSGRANNLDTFVENYIRNGSNSAFQMGGGEDSHQYVNNVVENCGGSVAVNSYTNRAVWVGGRVVGSAANTALFSIGYIVEGVTLDDGAGSAIVVELKPSALDASQYATNNHPIVANCDSSLCSLGGVLSAPRQHKMVLINNQFPGSDNAGFSKPVSAFNYNDQGTIGLGDDTRGSQLTWVDGTVVTGSRVLRDDGISTGTDPYIYTVGIGSQQAFGSPTFSFQAATLTVTGIATALAFGSPTVSGPAPVTVSPSGIVTREAFGIPSVPEGNAAQTIGTIAITSAEAFGVPQVTAVAPATILVVGIASALAFGTPVIGLPPVSTRAGFIMGGYPSVHMKTALMKSLEDRRARMKDNKNPAPPPVDKAKALIIKAAKLAISGNGTDEQYREIMKEWEKEVPHLADPYPVFMAKVHQQVRKMVKKGL